jgi:Cdc25 family phosphatase
MPILTVEPAELARWLTAPPDARLWVVDVRDDDREGGHIPQSLHLPSTQFLTAGADALMSEIQSTLSQSMRHRVVFHCMLSQVRGPKCARIFYDMVQQKQADNVQVFVLRGGFSAWHDANATTRPDLIEDYDAERWRQGFF